MSVHPHPEGGPRPERGDHNPDEGQQISASDRERLQQVHADPDQLNREAREQDSRRGQGVNDPNHYAGRPEDFSHGRHGKGFGDEEVVNEKAVDTGDDRQLRTAGGGGDQAPDPNKFRENSAGRMGGPGWGNEQAGGASVDRRPDDSNA
jgi:hypothetical protein